jgi:hypothetical protein
LWAPPTTSFWTSMTSNAVFGRSVKVVMVLSSATVQMCDNPRTGVRQFGVVPRMSCMTTHWTLGGDAVDPQRLARFWALALGYVDEPGYDFPGGASLVDPEGRLPAISFLKVPEGKTAKNRLHIDIRVAAGRPMDPAVREQRIRAKVSDLITAGATVVRVESYEHLDHVVMQDPEGNEFCVA